MRSRWGTTLALGGAILLAAGAATAGTGAVAWAAPETAAAGPAASLETGRYTGAQSVTLTAAPGAEIRYTLDGTMPTRTSTAYSGPIRIERSANLTAIAFTPTTASAPTIRGYLIKTAEQPLAQFAVMSDIHLSSDSPALVKKWEGYFDTLKRIAPHPDAIVSNGDQINDNNHDTAADHRFPRAMLEQNLARTGMTDTDVLVTFGNHDDYVDRMAAQYPKDWFPQLDGKGYYETKLGGFPAFVVNTESWTSAQATWLYGRLSTLSKDPATQGQPIFVFGHRPIPNTVWDGAQTSNPGLKTNLDDFPQVVFFSGHSHLNITDERSIHQDTFTSVNEGSMSYEEIDSMYQAFGAGLAKEHTIPTAQSVLVEVYGDRVEVDRINYAADAGRTYDDAGKWGFQQNPPFRSTGTLAGPTWVIGRGATPAEIKSKFVYTQANRNASAPSWGAEQPTVRQTATGPVLRLPQAADDQFVNDYSLALKDVAAGTTVNLVGANDRLAADYVFTPRPAALDIPLALRGGGKTNQPVTPSPLVAGREYEATLVAYDSYRNASAPRTFRFVAGALDRAALDAAVPKAQELIGTASRVLGDETPAQAADFGFTIADPAAARDRISQLTAQVDAAGAPAGANDAAARAAAGPATQDEVDAAAARIVEGTSALQQFVATVDRAPLTAALDAAKPVVARAKDDTRAVADRLRAAQRSAVGVSDRLNVPQPGIDAAAHELDAAVEAYRAAGTPTPNPTPKPTEQPTPKPTTGPSTPPSTGTGTGSGTGEGDGLAKTGAESLLPAAGTALALAAAGGGLLLRRRRHRNG
ncbi:MULTISPECIES: chitobiase/beta-hexosaminidase C-terminal domain-containing protein [unclassified Leucobacter]